MAAAIAGGGTMPTPLSGRSNGFFGSARDYAPPSELVAMGFSDRPHPSVQAELLVSRKDLEFLDDKLSRQLRLFKTHGEQAIEVVTKPLETKMGMLEVKHPRLEWQMTDLDGTVKALAQQVEVQRRHSDALEGALQRTRKNTDDARMMLADLQEECRQLMGQAHQEQAFQQANQAQQEQNNTNLQTLMGIVQDTQRSQTHSPAPAYPAYAQDPVTREELMAVADSIQQIRSELAEGLAEVANSCALKPNRQTVVTRQELTSATDLLRQDLRLEMRQFADKVAYGEQTKGEIDRELESLREDLGSIKARETIGKTTPRGDAELLVETAVDTLRQELRQRGGFELQGSVARMEASQLDLAHKVDRITEEFTAQQVKIHDGARSAAIEAALEAVDEVTHRCQKTEDEYKQLKNIVSGAVSSMAATLGTVHQLPEEFEYLQTEVGDLRQFVSSLSPELSADSERSFEALKEIREVHSKVAELCGEVSGHGVRISASEQHFGALAELPMLRSALNQYREECAALAPRIDQCRSECAALVPRVDQYRDDCAVLAPRVAQCRDECAAMVPRVDRCREECAALIPRVNQCRDECSALAPRIDHYRVECAALVPRVIAGEETLIHLRANVLDLQAKLVCNCGSVFMPDSAFCRKCGVKREGHEGQDEFCQSPVAGVLERLSSPENYMGAMKEAMAGVKQMQHGSPNSDHLEWVPELHFAPGLAHRSPSQPGHARADPALSRLERAFETAAEKGTLTSALAGVGSTSATVPAASSFAAASAPATSSTAVAADGDTEQHAPRESAVHKAIVSVEHVAEGFMDAVGLGSLLRRDHPAAQAKDESPTSVPRPPTPPPPLPAFPAASAEASLEPSASSSRQPRMTEFVVPRGSLSAELFARIDVNNDGVIDRTELRTALAAGVLEKAGFQKAAASAEKAGTLERQSSFESLPDEEIPIDTDLKEFFPDPNAVSFVDPRKQGQKIGVIGFHHPGHDEPCDQLCSAAFLGNFWRLGNYMRIIAPGSQIAVDFSNSEAAFHALKHWALGQQFAHLSGEGAVLLNQTLDGKEDFSFCGYGSNWAGMMAVLRVKFSQESLKKGLLQTGDAFLLEHRSVEGRDKVWSDNCKGDGTNWLGLLLMVIRDELSGRSEWTNYISKHIDLKTGHPRSDASRDEWQGRVQKACWGLVNALTRLEKTQTPPRQIGGNHIVART